MRFSKQNVPMEDFLTVYKEEFEATYSVYYFSALLLDLLESSFLSARISS